MDGNMPTRIKRKYQCNRTEIFAPLIITSNFNPVDSDPRLAARLQIFEFEPARFVFDAKGHKVAAGKRLVDFLEGHVDEQKQIQDMKCETASFFFFKRLSFWQSCTKTLTVMKI